MLETISRGFRSARDHLAGVTSLTDTDIDKALRDVRMSLLEADVEFRVTKDFLANVREKAIGETVRLRARAKGKKSKVSPADHFIKICQDELTHLMGPVDIALNFAKKGPTCIMMVGLQGSGKTTTTGKVARYLEKQGRRPLLVAADVYRPAAIDQLKILGERLDMPVYADDSNDPPGICERAVAEAQRSGRDIVLLDTAGRLAIDEPLMAELDEIKLRTRPANILIVVDSMMGQDAVKTAKAFNDRLQISGVVLTKLDGDARGGAALSVKAVTGAPIKFLGMGESLDKLEVFRPEGLASRILGMGDVVGLMKDFEDVVDAEAAEQEAVAMMQGRFNMADFLKQIKTIQKMGSLSDLFDKLPFFPNGLPDGVNLDDGELVKIEAIIGSMTRSERENPALFIKSSEVGAKDKIAFHDSRISRVARGSGRNIKDVKDLLNKFGAMKEMMLEVGQSAGLVGKIPGLKQLSQLKKMAGVDVNKMMEMMGVPGQEQQAANRPKPRLHQSAAARANAKKKRKNARKSRRKSR